MPRIRSLKPEHKQHRKVGKLSHVDYRLWVGMITEADDEGRLVADPDQLRIIVFPYHAKVTEPQVQAGLERLAGVGLCRLYLVEGVQYAVLPSFRDHQRISHPAKSKLPGPPHQSNTGGVARTPEDSGGFARTPQGSDLIGSDRKGSDLDLNVVRTPEEPGTADAQTGEVEQDGPRTPAEAAAKVAELVAKATHAAPGAPVRGREITLEEARQRGARAAASARSEAGRSPGSDSDTSDEGSPPRASPGDPGMRRSVGGWAAP